MASDAFGKTKAGAADTPADDAPQPETWTIRGAVAPYSSTGWATSEDRPAKLVGAISWAAFSSTVRAERA